VVLLGFLAGTTKWLEILERQNRSRGRRRRGGSSGDVAHGGRCDYQSCRRGRRSSNTLQRKCQYESDHSPPAQACCCRSTLGARWGHSNGMIAWDGNGNGFMMQVSTPSWPGSGSARNPRQGDGNTLGRVADECMFGSAVEGDCHETHR
jgi:hypothetical protein